MISLVTFSLVAFASSIGAAPSGHHLQHIPVPGYDPKLEFLGQHVDLHEIPTKIIRITKTVAIKVPVPYPVKIPHNVPYPVHVNKPYPVPVTQIIKVPHPVPVPVPSSGGSAWPSHEEQGGSQYSGVNSYGHIAQDGGGHAGGNGYESQYAHGLGDGSQAYSSGEHYGESQQVAGSMAYQHPSATAHQQADASSFQHGGQQGYGGAEQPSAHQGNNESYQINVEQSQLVGEYTNYQHASDPSAYQSVSNYHMAGPEHLAHQAHQAHHAQGY